MRPILLLTLLLLTACGGGSRDAAPGGTTAPAPAGGPAFAALGDSITAGSPLWDPDPDVRARIGPGLDRRSQFEFFARERLGPAATFRNCGVFGERTDEIADRLEECAQGARTLIVQGGINDIAQGRDVADAAEDLRAMVRRGKALGLRVVLVDVLPWNNGYPAAAGPIDDLNGRIRALGREERVRVLPFFATLEDPANPGRIRREWTIDGDHPSVAGYERLGRLIPAP